MTGASVTSSSASTRIDENAKTPLEIFGVHRFRAWRSRARPSVRSDQRPTRTVDPPEIPCQVARVTTQPSGTRSGAFFYDEAVDLERRLRGDDSPRARELAARARRLREIFEGWAGVRPDPELKAQVVHDLFDLNRAVLEHVGALSGVRRSAHELPSLADDDD
jgi:hypothetical protein